MSTPNPDTKDFAAAVIDALDSHICVIDHDGVIVAVNRAWQNFANENPPVSDRVGIGVDYLNVCRQATGAGAEEALEFAEGIQAVLDEKSEVFKMEYPCHSPTQNRWFQASVTPLRRGCAGAVISHTTITDRKLLELDLVKLSSTDPLTGVPNRRYLLELANLEVERVNRFGAAASLLMIDLDHFKAVNDTHGHAVGDQALLCLTRVCKKRLRQIDVLARIGGEEFVILLPGTHESGAVRAGEAICRAVRETPVKGSHGQFHITASVGAAEIMAGDKSIDDCLARADRALYAAKRAGRNRVTGFASLPGAAAKPGA